MQRSSTKTIIISLVFAAIFGLVVLWGSVQVQIQVLTWWDGKTSTQEYKNQSASPSKSTPVVVARKPPTGNWDSSPPLSEAMLSIIAEIEENEKLYNQITNIETISSSESISERNEYSLDGELWTTNRDYLVWKALGINPNVETGGSGSGYFGAGFQEKSSSANKTSTEELDPAAFTEAFTKANESIQERAGIYYSQNDSHQIYQDEKRWHLGTRYVSQKYLMDPEHPLPKSPDDLKLPENIEPVENTNRRSQHFDSFDGRFRYSSSLNDEYRRDSERPKNRTLTSLYDLYSGGSQQLKRMKDLFQEIQTPRYYNNTFSETDYLGEEQLEGEPVKVVRLNVYNSQGPKKLQNHRKLYLAHNKNYLPVRVEYYELEVKEPFRVIQVTSLTEIKPDLWFPLEIIETGNRQQMIEWSASAMGNISPTGKRSAYKRIKKYTKVSLNPDYEEKYFSTVPNLSDPEMKYVQVAEKFAKHLQNEELQEIQKLSIPETYQKQVLKYIKEAPIMGRPLELHNYELHRGHTYPDGRVQGAMVGVTFHAYNRKFTQKPVGSLDLLLMQDEKGNWKIEGCAYNIRGGFDQLMSEKRNQFYSACQATNTPRPPVAAEKPAPEMP